jgi:hypothetical protein
MVVSRTVDHIGVLVEAMCADSCAPVKAFNQGISEPVNAARPGADRDSRDRGLGKTAHVLAKV